MILGPDFSKGRAPTLGNSYALSFHPGPRKFMNILPSGPFAHLVGVLSTTKGFLAVEGLAHVPVSASPKCSAATLRGLDRT